MSPFQIFLGWLFDGQKTTKIPPPEYDDKGKVTSDILKYNSPITVTYVISLFQKYPNINNYLDEYMNNINLRYLSKEDFFYFVKKVVIDFNIKRSKILFIPSKKYKKINIRLQEIFKTLKGYEIEYLADIIEKLDEKDSIYQSLGIDVPKKEKIKNKIDGYSLDRLLDQFSIVRDE